MDSSESVRIEAISFNDVEAIIEGTCVTLDVGVTILGAEMVGFHPVLYVLTKPQHDIPQVRRRVYLAAQGTWYRGPLFDCTYAGRITLTGGSRYHVFVGPEEPLGEAE